MQSQSEVIILGIIICGFDIKNNCTKLNEFIGIGLNNNIKFL